MLDVNFFEQFLVRKWNIRQIPAMSCNPTTFNGYEKCQHCRQIQRPNDMNLTPSL